ncbi:hypothetical protein O9929_23560 [Vibrio lentus]|nr:hypothetical protein [Vibrio lentus]
MLTGESSYSEMTAITLKQSLCHHQWNTQPITQKSELIVLLGGFGVAKKPARNHQASVIKCWGFCSRPLHTKPKLGQKSKAKQP